MRIVEAFGLHLAVLVFFFIVACGEKAEDSRPTQMSEAIELHVEAPEQAAVGDLVNLRLIVENRSLAVAELRGARPYDRYSFVVTDQAGQEVWRSRFGEDMWAVEVRWTVAPMQEIVYDEIWNTMGNDGEPVPPGTYFVRGTVELTGPTVTSPDVEITIS